MNISIEEDKIDFRLDNELKSYLPDLKEKEFRELKKSIKREGCREPLIIWEEKNTLIDGHHRLSICQDLNENYNTKKRSFQFKAQVIAWIIENQLGQRNLNDKQYDYYLGKRYMNEKKDIGRPKSGQNVHFKTAEKIANEENTNEKTVRRNADFAEAIDRIAKNTSEKFRTTALSEDLLLSKSAIKEIGNLDKEEQEKIVDLVSSGKKLTKKDISQIKSQKKEKREKILDIMSNEGKSLREAKKQIRQIRRSEKARELKEKNQVLPEEEREYQLILADPPWKYEHTKTDNRKVENHYPTMSLADIKALPVQNISNKDSLLYLWTTSPKLAESIEVINSWRFNYRTNMVWVKDKIGMGYYARQRHELLLIAKRGSPPTPKPEDRRDSVIRAPRKEHSKKPEKVYDIIENLYPDLPKIELFARKKRENWEVWGNEVTR